MRADAGDLQHCQILNLAVQDAPQSSNPLRIHLDRSPVFDLGSMPKRRHTSRESRRARVSPLNAFAGRNFNTTTRTRLLPQFRDSYCPRFFRQNIKDVRR